MLKYNIVDIVGKIVLLKLILPSFFTFVNMTTRKFKTVVCIIFLLDSADFENFLGSQ